MKTTCSLKKPQAIFFKTTSAHLLTVARMEVKLGAHA